MASVSTPRVREATKADKDGYVHAILSGYEVDHQFQYRYPHRKDYPEDAINATGDVFEAALENANTTCLVAEVPSNNGPTKWVIAAAGCWEWKHLEDVEAMAHPSGFSSPDTSRRDMDPVRQKLFIDAITAAEKEHFGPEWGQKRMELADLACDPAYHRRGAGKALTQWGLDRAREQDLPAMLTASPLGRLVYLNLGFKELGYVECGVEGEVEKVGVAVMVWTPPRWVMPGTTK